MKRTEFEHDTDYWQYHLERPSTGQFKACPVLLRCPSQDAAANNGQWIAKVWSVQMDCPLSEITVKTLHRTRYGSII